MRHRFWQHQTSGLAPKTQDHLSLRNSTVHISQEPPDDPTTSWHLSQMIDRQCSSDILSKSTWTCCREIHLHPHQIAQAWLLAGQRQGMLIAALVLRGCL